MLFEDVSPNLFQNNPLVSFPPHKFVSVVRLLPTVGYCKYHTGVSSNGIMLRTKKLKKKSKAIPVTGCGGL
jgi:hypothetical protein